MHAPPSPVEPPLPAGSSAGAGSIALIWLLLAVAPVRADEPAPRQPRDLPDGSFDSGRIVQLEADGRQGVWALTRNGKLYYCRVQTEPPPARIDCIGRDGAAGGDF